MAREQPEQQAPPVQRLRVRYTKRGRLRFTSHRDFSRAFERAVVRAGVPMAYSSGFHPHPRISYANAAPTGSASEAEFLELGLREQVDADDVRAALDAAMPDGLDVVEVVELATTPGTRAEALADRLQASRWLVELPTAEADLRAVTDRFLAEESVVVERMTKKGLRSFDCREAVLAVEVGPAAEGRTGSRLDLVLRHGTPAVRPDDVLAGLTRLGLEDAAAALLTRLAQGPLREGASTLDGWVGDPLHD